MCDNDSPVIENSDEFIGFEYGYLCSSCVCKVKQGGHWKKRRLNAVRSRTNVLLETYPDLKVVKSTDVVSQLEGVIDNRLVEVRLRVKERDGERFIFHVEHLGGQDTSPIESFRFPDPINSFVHGKSPRFTRTKQEWIRIGFRHLGRLDVLTVIECMLELAVKNDQYNKALQPPGWPRSF